MKCCELTMVLVSFQNVDGRDGVNISKAFRRISIPELIFVIARVDVAAASPVTSRDV
jgi:hypothetical protein